MALILYHLRCISGIKLYKLTVITELFQRADKEQTQSKMLVELLILKQQQLEREKET